MSERERLPDRRQCQTFKIRLNGGRAAYHVTVGYYPPLDSGRIGEIFIATNSVGSMIDAMARDLAVLSSIALQHGAAPEVIAHALTREGDGSPSTIIGAVFDRLSASRGNGHDQGQ